MLVYIPYMDPMGLFEWERLISRWNAMFSNEPSSGALKRSHLWLHGNLKLCERVTRQHLLQVGTLALALEHFWLPRGHTVPRKGTHQAVDPSMRFFSRSNSTCRTALLLRLEKRRICPFTNASKMQKSWISEAFHLPRAVWFLRFNPLYMQSCQEMHSHNAPVFGPCSFLFITSFNPN